MFFVIKDEDRRMAKDGVIPGVIRSVIEIIIISIIYAGKLFS